MGFEKGNLDIYWLLMVRDGIGIVNGMVKLI